MLTLYGNHQGRRSSRREFLQIGSSAIGGLSLASLFAARANAEEQGAFKDKSIVILNLQGGPTQFQQVDPLAFPALEGVATFVQHGGNIGRLIDGVQKNKGDPIIGEVRAKGSGSLALPCLHIDQIPIYHFLEMLSQLRSNFLIDF